MSDTNIEDLLNEAAGPESAAVLGATEGAASGPVRPGSPNVLDVDRWAQRRGEELSDDWAKIADSEYPAPLAADAHQALFSPAPEFAEHPAEKERAAWFKQLTETDDFRRLHAQTCLDTAISELAAKGLADKWLQYAVDHQDPEPGEPEPGSDNESLSKSLDRIRSTKAALQEAADTVQTAQDVSYGLGEGTDGDKLDAQVLAKYFQQVRNDDFLRRLMAMAGRMRRLCQTLQRTKVQHGRDDMVGVELGGDIARLLPSELAQLESGVEELELLALDRIARGQALCRQYHGLETLGRGPIVVVLDESGSMGGDPIIAAKGMALALTWLAKQQNRWIALVGFSGSGSYHRIAFRPGRVDHGELVQWLTHFFGGGTVLPLDQLIDDWAHLRAKGLPKGKTDVIFVTDAQCNVSSETQARYHRWAHDEQVRTYGIVLGQPQPGVLGDISTRAWCVQDLSLESPAVEGVLSI